ncbi:MAG: hypothetical protein KDD03_02610 [Gelidibacter sp.]|nr:hypothetical protein [Gelidibacter sp.]
MDIQKVKYSRKNNKVTVDYFDHRGKWSGEITVDPHPDFIKSLDAITEDMVLICELNDESIWKYKVTGISIGGEDEYLGVVIIGQKEVLNKKVFNIITPFVMFEEEHSDYENCGDLKKKVDLILKETEELLNGKTSQMKLDFHDKTNSLKMAVI